MIDTPEQRAKYESDVARAVIGAILDLYPDESGQAGMVDLDGAFRGITAAIAMMAHNTGAYATPAKQRALADKIRKELLISIRVIQAAADEGGFATWPDATLIEPKRN